MSAAFRAFGQKKRARVFIEQAALAFPRILCNGGRRGLQVELAPGRSGARTRRDRGGYLLNACMLPRLK